MDKRWRNLGVLVIIVILIVGGYYFYSSGAVKVLSNIPGITSSGKEITLDQGYIEFIALFENSDVNMDNVQLLYMIDSNAEKIVWVEKKENLIKLKSALTDFARTIKSRATPTVAAELSDISDLYVGAIDFALQQESTYQKVYALSPPVQITCADVSVFDATKSASNELYSKLYTLSIKNDTFSGNYGSDTSPLSINVQEEYAGVVSLNSFVDNIKSLCSGVVP